MKKVLLTAMALLTIASASVFGMYGDNSDWIDFLVHGNQLRARMNQFGFTLGNGTIKGTFGFKNDGGLIITPSSVTPSDADHKQQDKKVFYNFNPVISAGIGYTTEAFGIGIGYNYRYIHSGSTDLNNDGTSQSERILSLKGYTTRDVGLSVHTPVIAFNALNNNLRIVVPIQIAAKNNNFNTPANATTGFDYKNEKYLGLSLDPQIRFYPGLDFLTEFRLTVKYGMNQVTYNKPNANFTKFSVEKNMVSSFGFDFRTYFAAQVGDVGLAPFIKITYDTALDKQAGDYAITAGSAYIVEKGDDAFDSNPWKLVVLPTLGLSAGSDFVTLYAEAGLGYKAVNTGYTYDKNSLYANRRDVEKSGIKHTLAWRAYGEIYITPVKDLEWYFEAEIGNDVTGYSSPFEFASSTGITWYLPSLNGAE
ncbi:cell surface protein [Brachyspira pulli]|uniref:cell surface protein n=1 Tax=Brachyspira pulli TaxID=310721 RepID=UPI003003CC39